MTNLLGAGAPAALERALDVAAYRETLIASNIANVDTPGYRAKDVDFVQELRDAVRASREPEGPPTERGKTLHEPETGRIRGDGNTVDVDREMLNLSRTAGFYQASVELLRKYIGILRTAVTDGRS
jgi:flagellar basal-body rod protein FlgB